MTQIVGHELGPREFPNPVFDTADAFLKVAEAEFIKEVEKKVFLIIQNWFVAHHLSVVATELFLKSFRVVVSYSPVTSDDGPDDMLFKHAFDGHVASLHKLPKDVSADLKSYLPEPLYNLMKTLSKDEISRGRYPYEDDNGTQRFPAGDAGKKLANDWLALARALSKFRD